jgi:ribonuclease HI
MTYLTEYETSIHLGTMATVFQAEVYAIGHSANYINRHATELIEKGIRNVDIVTDSMAALQAIDAYIFTSKLVKDCFLELEKADNKIPIKIHWIKAHVGHEGNERADLLAKKGASTVNTCVEPIIPVPKSWIKGKIKMYVHDEWKQRWEGIQEARQTRIFFPEPNIRKSKKLMSYDKQTCGKMFRWISGHSFHRYHNYLTDPERFGSSMCRACREEREETSHLFAFCGGLAHVRMRLLGKAMLDQKFDWQPHQLISMIEITDKLYPEEGVKGDIPTSIGQEGLADIGLTLANDEN